MAEFRKGQRITGSARKKLAADLKKKYEKGASIRELAEATGRSYGLVHRLLTEAGVEIRGTSSSAENRIHADTMAADPAGATRRDAHRLVDQVPESQVQAAVELLRQFTVPTKSERTRRQFRTVGAFDGDPELAAQSKDILRRELGGRSDLSA